MFLFFPIPALIQTVLISLIALLTLLGIMFRPYKLSEAIIALSGAGLLLILGLLRPGVALTTLLRDWNTFLFFLGMHVFQGIVRDVSSSPPSCWEASSRCCFPMMLQPLF